MSSLTYRLPIASPKCIHHHHQHDGKVLSRRLVEGLYPLGSMTNILLPEAAPDVKSRPNFDALRNAVTYPQDVVEALWRAATDVSDQLHFRLAPTQSHSLARNECHSSPVLDFVLCLRGRA